MTSLSMLLLVSFGCAEGPTPPADSGGTPDAHADTSLSVDSGAGSSTDGSVFDGSATDASTRDAATLDASETMDAGGLIIVTPANSSRTILPGCVNGIMFSGLLPSCMGDVGVARGERYAMRFNFWNVYERQPLEGTFTFDETTGGAYHAAISEMPGSFDVPDGCKSVGSPFPNLQYLDQIALDEITARYPSLTEADILKDHCLLDPSKTYYLNVDVIGSCRADDPRRNRCWASILQKHDQFQY